MPSSTRTPEGFPSRCPLCGADTNLEYSPTTGDAPCPNCGHLLWYCFDLLSSIQEKMSRELGETPGRITAESSFTDLGFDSLETVELVMELEEELNLSVPDEVAENFHTVGDVIRYLGEQRRKRGD